MTDCALGQIILKNIDFSFNEQAEMEDLLSIFDDGQCEKELCFEPFIIIK